MNREFRDYLEDMLTYAEKAAGFVGRVSWQKIVRMRNILIHNYDAADPRIVYDTVTISLPERIAALPIAIAAADEAGSPGG